MKHIPLKESDIPLLKQGDKLLCIEGSCHIKEKIVYTFKSHTIIAGRNYISLMELPLDFYYWRFVLYNPKTPRGNKKCNAL